MSQFWRFDAARDASCCLYLCGVLEFDEWCDEHDFLRALGERDGETLTVVIDSPGGDVATGIALYDALARRKGETRAEIIRAYSAATLPLMGCDRGKRNILPYGTVLIHNPQTFAQGTWRDMDSASELLKSLGESVMRIYTQSSGKTAQELQPLMDAETIWNAEAAVANGFADRVVDVQEAGAAMALYAKATMRLGAALAEEKLRRQMDEQLERQRILCELGVRPLQ